MSIEKVEIYQLNPNNTPQLTDLVPFSNESVSHRTDISTWLGVLNTFFAAGAAKASYNVPATSAVNFVLSNPLATFNNVSFSTSGKAVLLPDMSQSKVVPGQTIIIYNSGSLAYSVFYIDGTTLISTLAPGQFALLYVVSTLTSNGIFIARVVGSLSTQDIPVWFSSVAANVLTNIGAEATANKNIANGYAGLDSGGHLLISQYANQVTGTTTTSGTSTSAVCSFPFSVANKAMTVEAIISGFEASTLSSARIRVLASALYNGTIVAIDPNSVIDTYAPPSLSNINATIGSSGSQLTINIMGMTGLTIQWAAVGTYVIAG